MGSGSGNDGADQHEFMAITDGGAAAAGVGDPGVDHGEARVVRDYGRHLQQG